MNSKRYENRFTLIELLAVVALISLLMGIGVPAFARMIRGSRVDECARNIKLALEQAQMLAASERRYVAVVFPNGEVDSDVSQTLSPYRLGGFRIAYVKKKGNGVYGFSKWVDGSNWSNAPSGAMLTRIGTKYFDADSSSGDITGCTKKIDDKLEGADELKALADVKDDNGDTLKVGKKAALIYTPYGGIVSSAKLYLLISEATVDGDSIVYPTAGVTGSNRTSNYKVLKVNNLTGRVEFYDEDDKANE